MFFENLPFYSLDNSKLKLPGGGAVYYFRGYPSRSNQNFLKFFFAQNGFKRLKSTKGVFWSLSKRLKKFRKKWVSGQIWGDRRHHFTPLLPSYAFLAPKMSIFPFWAPKISSLSPLLPLSEPFSGYPTWLTKILSWSIIMVWYCFIASYSSYK